VRQLALVFGVTAYAISTVLSSFFAGLALGSFLAGRVADRLRRPLRAYAAAEVLVAASALLTPAAFALARAIYTAIHDGLPADGLWLLTLIRFVLAFLVLLVPTTLMGATLPLVVRSSLAGGSGFARNLSLLYAANTFGAMIGTFVAGFYLIGRYGLQTTLLIAVAGSLCAALVALALDWYTGPLPESEAAAVLDEPPVPDSVSGMAAGSRERLARYALVVFGISGGVSLAYEVVWARVLAIFFDASTYGFTAMLTMVLFGIGLGSWLVSAVINRRWNWPLIFAGIQAAVGLIGLLSAHLLVRLIPLAGRLGLYEDPGPLGQFSVRFMVFAAFVVVFPPMLLLGASFPIAARIVGTAGGVGRRVGGVYAINVFGGIIGALIGGFVLIPAFGVRTSLLLLACINLALALVLVWPVAAKARTFVLVSAGALVVAAAGILTAPNLLRDIFKDRFANQDVRLVSEGLENTVAVADLRDTGERKLYINGQPQASTAGFIAGYHQFIGHLAMVLHPQPERALVIGLGGGATAGALASHAGTEVDIVELSSAVVDAAPLFRSVNGDVLLRPNVHLHVDDGRNFLLLTDRRYDVITADIIRPTHAGATNLYSREYYRLAKGALADDGIMVQWLEQLSEEHYKILMRSFVETFPYVTVWAEGSVLVGSKQPLTLDCATLERRLNDSEARNPMVLLGLIAADDVLRLYMGDRLDALRYLQGESRAVSDNRPYVEFHRTLHAERRPPDVSGFRRDPRQLVGANAGCLP
jgi:spermidine synthase